LAGENMGLMSEAGCPGVADPGAVIVKLAHEKAFKYIPLDPHLFFGNDGLRNEWTKFYFSMATCQRRKKASFKTLERISFEKTNLKFLLKLLTETINY
jgi:16S rRNA (cytidine1402-2'-O)-methyltransferase